MKKALIAMSGGVDSSVAAKLMSERGFSCIGCTMKLFNNEDAGVKPSKACCSLEDTEDARSVAYSIGMPYYVFNFTDSFKEEVIARFIRAYEEGRTPNPCIDCNRYEKFGKLYERARILGCDCIATGHYARIESTDGQYFLKKGLDPAKDQSYVLYFLTQEMLSRTIFPLGGMHKTEVRALAEQYGFVNAEKPDSQDICFVPDGDYASVIETNTGKTYPPGDFTDEEGNVLGRHKGIIHYTVGQRRGLGISSTEPWYVKRLDVPDNRVILSRNRDLFSKEVKVSDFNWISGHAPEGPVRCTAKIRYRHKEQPATAFPEGEDKVKILFDEPVRAVTAGQAAVIYDGDTVLGGGVIQ
ncbi:MAG: tRNA 2-thiouridine(34) synthase MnmA [Eubacterium sp.]|nr:tRNA 2-thiouridine(34) synthase MnmA [Eubacterium sp.]